MANVDLTAELALDLAVAAAYVLGDLGAFDGHAERRPVAVVGNDSRASGEFLEAAVVAGLLSSGVDVWRVGVLPTPAIAYLTAALDADLALQFTDLHRQRGLADRAVLRRPAEMAVAGERGHIAELAQCYHDFDLRR